MIIVRLKGGLGNQLFQYAAARALAHRHGTALKLDLEEFSGGTEKRPEGLEAFTRKVMLGHFQTRAEEATAEEADRLRDPFRYSKTGLLARGVRALRRWRTGLGCPSSHIRERAYTFDPSLLGAPDDSYLEGFWQSEKYFAPIAPAIREEFKPRDQNLVLYAERYLRDLRPKTGAIVSLHVRRGDLTCANELLGKPGLVHGNAVGLDYILGAQARFPKESSFLVFSDSSKDLEWCRQNVRGQSVFFADGHTDMQDFVLMSRCDHNIIANSTFSWWAAWLNQTPGRRVVAPRLWASPRASAQMDTRDLLPPEWEVL
jgi:hypothetical protein